MAAILTVRQVNAQNDPMFGNSKANYIADLAAAAQVLATQLKFLLGEWWEDLSIGFPLFQKLVGADGSAKALQTSCLAIQTQILSNSFVTAISSFVFMNNSGNRASFFTCNVDTIFGTLTLTNAPGTSAAVSS